MNVIQFPKLYARASLRRPIPSRVADPADADWRAFKRFLFTVAALVCVAALGFGFFLGQAIVTAIGKAAGWL